MTSDTINIVIDDDVTTRLNLAANMVEPSGIAIHRTSTFESSSFVDADSEKGLCQRTDNDTKIHSNPQDYISLDKQIFHQNIVQKLCVVVTLFAFFVIIKKVIRPNLLHDFFIWMEGHPTKGLIAYTLLYPFHMVLLLPGSPLVLGAGFIFKTQYGWVSGVLLCSILTLFGSLLGSIICFFLGRYWIREPVRRWSRKYPLFDAIDAGKPFVDMINT